MFIIPCKYTKNCNSVIELVKSIREYHPTHRIMVVDSASSDKSYFNEIEPYNVDIQDIDNKNWSVGAFWHGYFKYPNEKFYYCINDSMKVKANLSDFESKELVTLATFNREINPSFNAWNHRINTETKYTVTNSGNGVYGPIFMCSGRLFTNLYNKNANVLLPTCKDELGYLEGGFGSMFECEGFDMHECSLYGDILQHESPGGKSYPSPFDTSWQYPIEKFYGGLKDNERL